MKSEQAKLIVSLRELLRKKRISNKMKESYIEKINSVLSKQDAKVKKEIKIDSLPLLIASTASVKIEKSNYKIKLKKMTDCLQKAYKISVEIGVGDIYSYSKVKEVLIAEKLGHKVSADYSGADAYDRDSPVEYKSTISRTIKATYNGISVQPSWDDQIIYLKNDKIGKYKDHYFARFIGAKIVELYKMKCETILQYIIPRLKKQYFKEKKGKDPRLGITLGSIFIKKHSEKIV